MNSSPERQIPTTRHPLLIAILAIASIAILSSGASTALATPTPTLPEPSPETSESAPDPGAEGPGFGVEHSEVESDIVGGRDRDTGTGAPPRQPDNPPRYSYIWAPVSEFSGCGTNLDGGAWSCTPHADSCEAGSGSTVAGDGDVLEIGNVSTTPVEGVTQRGTRVNNETGETEDLGVRCALPGTPEFEEAPPVVIIVTQEDFARLPVEPLQAHAGPPEGWLPVNMVNVLYAEPEPQLLNTELLGTPVAIRATPVSYHWNLGDGNTIATSNPGKPFPSEAVSSSYTQEGWYDITLTTTFSGQFSVAGGEWQDIDGTIEVTSDPVPVFSKSLESRLVDGDVPVDEAEDPWIPERTPDTEGPRDPDARHREI